MACVIGLDGEFTIRTPIGEKKTIPVSFTSMINNGGYINSGLYMIVSKENYYQYFENGITTSSSFKAIFLNLPPVELPSSISPFDLNKETIVNNFNYFTIQSADKDSFFKLKSGFNYYNFKIHDLEGKSEEKIEAIYKIEKEINIEKDVYFYEGNQVVYNKIPFYLTKKVILKVKHNKKSLSIYMYINLLKKYSFFTESQYPSCCGTKILHNFVRPEMVSKETWDTISLFLKSIKENFIEFIGRYTEVVSMQFVESEKIYMDMLLDSNLFEEYTTYMNLNTGNILYRFEKYRLRHSKKHYKVTKLNKNSESQNEGTKVEATLPF